MTRGNYMRQSSGEERWGNRWRIRINALLAPSQRSAHRQSRLPTPREGTLQFADRQQRPRWAGLCWGMMMWRREKEARWWQGKGKARRCRPSAL